MKLCTRPVDLTLTFLQSHIVPITGVTLWTPQLIELFDIDLRSWFQQLARMMKLCTTPIVLTLTFPWPFCKVTWKLKFFHIVSWMRGGGSLVDTCNSFNHLTLIINNVFTVSNDDVVVHKTYCLDLDLSLMLWKVTTTLYSFHFVLGDLTPSELLCSNGTI